MKILFIVVFILFATIVNAQQLPEIVSKKDVCYDGAIKAGVSYIQVDLNKNEIPKIEDTIAKYHNKSNLFFCYKDAQLKDIINLVEKYKIEEKSIICFNSNNEKAINDFLKQKSNISLAINLESNKQINDILKKYSPKIVVLDNKEITSEIIELTKKSSSKIMAVSKDDRVADYESIYKKDVDMVCVGKPDIFGYVVKGWPKPLFGPEKITLIAHRGGVVEGVYSENSVKALNAAIERGYKYVEVDIRKTADGVLIAQHDANFNRFYGVDKKVTEMNWSEIKKLKAPDGSSPITFEDYCALCQDKIYLMLDIKVDGLTTEELDAMSEVMRKYNLLENSLAFSYTEYFDGKMKISRNYKEIPDAFKNKDEDISNRYFIFESAWRLNKDMIRMAKQRGVTVVVALNIWSYRGTEHMKAALNEALYFMSLGVDTFQIDSDYDRFFKNINN